MSKPFPSSIGGRRLAIIALLCLTVVCAVLAVTQFDATARVIDIQPNASYKGGTIKSETAAKRGLACVQEASGKLTCFDTPEEMASSEVAQTESLKASGLTTASAAGKKRRARASVDCGLPWDGMGITQHIDFNYTQPTGWQIAGYARQNWYNMSGSYANSATSVSAGNHSGYLADNYGGGTPRLRLEINQCESSLSRVAFNDRAQSRYRN